MAQAKLRWGSFVLLSLVLASWVLTLGALSSINWMVCTDTQATRTDIATSQGAQSSLTYTQFSIPPVNTDNAVCSRSWRWEWWALFFEIFVITYAMVSTLLPNRLPRARFAVCAYLNIATLLVMIALNDNLSDVWYFWDQKRMFDQWTGAMKRLYMSAAALCAGWVLIAIFNFIYIGFALDWEVEKKAAAAPVPADIEAANTTQK